MKRILDGDGHIIERDSEIYEYLEPKSVFINPQPSISNPFTLQ